MFTIFPKEITTTELRARLMLIWPFVLFAALAAFLPVSFFAATILFLGFAFIVFLQIVIEAACAPFFKLPHNSKLHICLDAFPFHPLEVPLPPPRSLA